MNKFKIIVILSIIVTIASLFSAAYVYNVPTSITQNDEVFIKKILRQEAPIDSAMKNPQGFSAQLELIRLIQKSSFTTAPLSRSMPLNAPREPEDLFYSSHAHCFDRARYIDKALRFFGMEARYVAIFEDEAEYSFLETMITPSSATRSDSHAVVEVLTAKGWLIIDTRKMWLSLTEDLQPVSLRQLKASHYNNFAWHPEYAGDPWYLLTNDIHVIYGLYSRHGQFYSPYTRYIPDINWPDFIWQNLSALH